jgi:transcriptional antiterminator NusG
VVRRKDWWNLPGEGVKIVGGPFQGFIGRIEQADHYTGVLRVRLSFFGREDIVDLAFDQVERL